MSFLTRTILGLAFLIGVTLFVRHQYSNVIGEITKRRPAPTFAATDYPRRKCVLCNGTGRLTTLQFGARNATHYQTCPTCNGTGWLDVPGVGR